jgi:putative toxin-antitoxin system antitoxin component (TIGR02293 family)
MKPANKPSTRKRTEAKLVEESIDMVNEPLVPYGVASLDGRAMGLLDVKNTTNTLRFDTDLIQLIRAGISKKSLDHLIAQIGYSLTDIASLLHVSDRNIRRYTPAEKLNTEQSERLVEVAKLYAKGEDVFGTIETFNEWMEAKILALGNQTPKSYLDTSLGIQLIHKELMRIEYGVFA